MTLDSLEELLRQVAAGDLLAFERLLALDPPEIRDLSRTDFTLELTAPAVKKVLLALKERTFPTALIQKWGSFMVWGFYRSTTPGPPWRMHRDFVEPCDDEMLVAVSRLEELDEPGYEEITDRAIDDMIRTLEPRDLR